MEVDRAEWSQNVIKLAGIGTFCWDIQNGEFGADERFWRLLGYDEGSVFTWRFSRFLEQVHPDERSYFRGRLLALRADREHTFSVDQRMRTRSGAWKWVNIRCAIYGRGPDILPTQALGVISDVSHRHALVDELVHAQITLSGLIQSIPGAVYQRSHDGPWTMLYLSDRIAEISGYQAAEFTEQRRSWGSVIAPQDLDTMLSTIEHTLEEGEQFEVKYRIQTLHGEERWVLDRGRAVRAPITRNILYLSGVITDVTAQHLQQEELELVRAVVEHTNDGVLITEAEPLDEPGPKIVYVNPSQRQNSGYSREEIIGRTPRIFTGPNSSTETSRQIREAMERWEPIQVEVLNYRKDGSEYWSDLSIVPVSNESGWYTHWVSVQRDITARKAQEMVLQKQAVELREAKEMAELATQAKSDFLATMSHELRTPMNGIIGMTSMLRETKLDEEQKEYMETIRFSGEALLELINDILDYSKGEAGRIELEEYSFDLIHLIEESFELVAPKARAKGVKLAYVLSADIRPNLRGDSSRLRQVIVNLLSNAVKFTEQGEVSMRITLEESFEEAEYLLRFEVKDSGIGIPKDRQSRLFKPFSQVDTSMTRRFGGTGLGLAICLDLVTLMQGEIGVESEAGQGSTFWFTVRLRSQAEEPSVMEEEARRLLRGKKSSNRYSMDDG